MLYLIFLFPISTTIRYCRNIARGIVSAIREKKIDMLIMGWHGEHKTYGFRLGRTVDPIIERSPCNVVIMKNCSNVKFKRILVPLIGGPNGGYALEIASILADKDEGKICAYTVHSEKTKFNIENFIEDHKDRVSLPLDRITIKAIIASGPVEAILNEAKHYDLIVLGCTRDPLIYQIVRESIPDIVARKCDKPLIMVKASGGIRSWLKRWF
jgi:nucleotide-binding universal stress UspA family protein